MINNKFFDNYFKVLTLLFWPIIWYKWVALSIKSIETTILISYCSLSIIFMVLYIFFSKKNKDTKYIVVFYRISTLFAFISTLFSFVLFPTSYLWLYLKIVFVLIYFYCSCLKVYKYKIEEGVVGILSSLLLILITLLY